MSKDLQKLYQELQQSVNTLKTELNATVSELQNENEILKSEVANLSHKVEDLERRTKKYDLVFYGVEEDRFPDEKKVLSIIKDMLELICTKENFRYIYRIGKNPTDKKRPLVVEFQHYAFKKLILSRIKSFPQRLKSRGISIQSDYIKSDYEKKQFLVKQLKIAKSQNYNAKIVGMRLLVNGEEYTIERLQDENFGELGDERKRKLNDNAPATPIEKRRK